MTKHTKKIVERELLNTFNKIKGIMFSNVTLNSNEDTLVENVEKYLDELKEVQDILGITTVREGKL